MNKKRGLYSSIRDEAFFFLHEAGRTTMTIMVYFFLCYVLFGTHMRALTYAYTHEHTPVQCAGVIERGFGRCGAQRINQCTAS